MTVGLFIPCYIDQFYPHVGIATLQLLEKLNLQVEYPRNQTCCGQPMANAGFEHLTGDCNKLFIRNFTRFDYVVAPSGSCVLHLKEHLHSNTRPDEAAALRNKIYEFSEFLTDVIKVQKLSARFPHKVGIHQGCHGLRGLKLAGMSELVASDFSKPLQLLNMVQDLELIELQRKDECCGFGGTFAIADDKLHPHRRNGTDLF